MAYTVGSASVDIVPDFRNAQLAITKFFNDQKSAIRIPVKLDVSQTGTADVERQAAQVGTRVSKAMNDAAARNQVDADKLAIQMAEGREKAAAQRRAREAKQQAAWRLAELKADERALEEAYRLNEAFDRQRARSEKETLKQRLADLTEAHRINDAMDRKRAAQRLADLTEAHRINDAMDRARAAQRAKDARDEEIAARASLRVIQATADQKRKIADQEAREAAIRRERELRDQTKAIQDQARAAIRELNKELKTASAAEKIRIQIEIDHQKALLESREMGGLIMRSVQREIHQNAGLIAAAIAAVMAVGAPVAMAGAVTLFSGIGIAAAAQSQNVRSVWVSTWQGIRESAVADAQVLVPVLERAAGAIGQGFERMRPQIERAFSASAPYIESFTGSIIKASENALPGMVRATVAAGPAVQGLGNMFQSVGTGVSKFFDTLSTHAPAAGRSAIEVGRAVEALLPALAELLGQGAEAASVILPAFTGAFRTLNSVIQTAGGLIPMAVAGFMAFRAVQGTGKILQNFSSSMAMASLHGGTFAGTQNRVATAAHTAAKALPAVGVVAGLVGVAFAENERRMQGFAQALALGGSAAAAAWKQMENPGFFDRFIYNLTHLGNTMDVGRAQTLEAAKAHDEWMDSLSPLEKAQRQVEIATRAVSEAIDKYGPGSRQAKDASAELERKQADLRREQEMLDTATRGVTEAMVAQGDAVRSLADSSFAYEESLNDLEDAQAEYNLMLEEGNEEEKARALLKVQKAYSDVATAARDVALDAMPALLDADQKSILADKAQLDALLSLKAAHGDLGPILEAEIVGLQQSTGAANGATLAAALLASELAQVGVAAQSIPGEKAVTVRALTQPAIDQLTALGLKVEEQEDGSFKIIAETEDAVDKLDQVAEVLSTVDTTTATPIVDANDKPFTGILGSVLGRIGELNGQKPTPKADLDTSAFAGKETSARAAITSLHGQRPNPRMNLDDSGFRGTATGAFNQLHNLNIQRPNPRITAQDDASGTISRIASQLAGLRDKHIRLTTENVVINRSMMGGVFAARGGAVEDVLAGAIPRYAAGGSAPRYDDGGQTYGRGGPWDDLNTIRVSPGEHVLDVKDVALMGGQAGVYAFRDALNTGFFSGPGPDNSIRDVVAGAAIPRTAGPTSATPRTVSLYTPDVPSAVRALKAMEHEEAALAPMW